MTLPSINPTTGATVAGPALIGTADLEVLITKAEAAFQKWRIRPIAERAELMRKVASVLRTRKDEYARLMADEMGKPVTQGRGEIEKCAGVCEYYATNTEGFLKPEVIKTEASRSFVTCEPLGVIFAIMPWNFPFWQVFRFAAPNLMAGNTGLLKHAPNVSRCAIAIEAVFREAGFPDGVFTNLLIDHDQAAGVIAHRSVQGVTLTGSTRAGKAVARAASEHLKKAVLELGGSDPYLILADADLDLAVEACATSRLINSGQSCIAAKRIIVVDAVREAFSEKFVARMGRVRIGDPLKEDTEVGPQARADLRADLDRQVRESVAKGARCLLGGTLPEGPGFFYPPTVLAEVQAGQPAFDEELFGPVASIISVPDEATAIRTANDTVFGLGAAVFTRDIERGTRIATRELHAGCCVVNDFVRSDARLPFGGIKESGYGRELSHHGLKEFLNVKTVSVK